MHLTRRLLLLSSLCAAISVVPVLLAQTTVTYVSTDNKSDPITADSPTVLTIATGTAEQSGVISGSSIDKQGLGTLILSGANTYSGATTISGGILQIGNGGTSGNLGSGSIINNADLVFNRSNSLTLDSVISGTGSLSKTGSGTLTLTDANTYSGTTTINAGTLELAGASGGTQLWTSGKLTGDITVNNGATLLLSRNNSFGDFSTSSSPQITINAGGVVTNTDRFNTLVNLTLAGGTLSANGGVNDGFFPAYQLKGTVTASGAVASQITAPGGTNSFTRIQIGDNTIGGVTTFHVSDALGSLSIANALVDGNNINANATVASGLAKTGAGTLTFTGASTYTGGTTISAGTLFANNTSGSALGSDAVTVNSGATLGGSGSIDGSTTFNSGAHLAPGSTVGTLTFTNGLTLTAGAILDFQLGTTSDLLRVSGGTLSGPASGSVTLNLTDAGGFAAGTYTLFNFTSAATSSFDATDFTLGTTPSGYTYDLAVVGSALELTATVSAIPEPSTYAAIFGACALGLAAWRRRSASNLSRSRTSA
jgi:autotransporter-associated beta strand protein